MNANDWAMTLFAAGSIAATAVGIYVVDGTKESAPERTVNVCVLNDSAQPERQSAIDSILHVADTSFKNTHNITLNLQSKGVYTGELDKLIDRDRTRNPISFCPKTADIVIMFTSKNNLYTMVSVDSGYRDLGVSNAALGYALLTGINPKEPEECASNEFRASIIEHEIGHLFGLDHTEYGVMKKRVSCKLRSWSTDEMRSLKLLSTREELLHNLGDGNGAFRRDSIYFAKR